MHIQYTHTHIHTNVWPSHNEHHAKVPGPLDFMGYANVKTCRICKEMISPLFTTEKQGQKSAAFETFEQVSRQILSSFTLKARVYCTVFNVILLTLFRFSASNILALAAASFFFLLACTFITGVKVVQHRQCIKK